MRTTASPLSLQEMQAGLAAMALKLGQLQGSEPKERVDGLTDQPIDKKSLDRNCSAFAKHFGP
jgi:hypothetical protein